jgi:hypothetical protein
VIEKSQNLTECLGELDLADIIQDKIEDKIDKKLEEKGDKKVIEEMEKEHKKGKTKKMAGDKGELFPKHMRKPFLISMGITTLAYSLVMGGGILSFSFMDFLVAIPLVLLSVAAVNLGLELSSMFFNRLQHILSQWRIWAMGLVILFVSSIFGSPFGNPGKSYDPVKEKFKDKSLKKRWKKIKKRRSARTETGRTLTGIAFLFPFGLLLLPGNKYLDVIGDSGIFIALVGVTYSLLPVGQNPGKTIYKWNKGVFFPLALFTAFLFLVFTLTLTPDWLFFIFGMTGCLLLVAFSMYIKIQVEKEKKKLKSKEGVEEISKVKEGEAFKIAEEVGEFERKLEKARAKVAHYTAAENSAKIEKWTGRVAKYEQKIVELKVRYAKIENSMGIGEEIDENQSATTPAELETESTMSTEDHLDIPVTIQDTSEPDIGDAAETDEQLQASSEIQEPTESTEEKDDAENDNKETSVSSETGEKLDESVPTTATSTINNDDSTKTVETLEPSNNIQDESDQEQSENDDVKVQTPDTIEEKQNES